MMDMTPILLTEKKINYNNLSEFKSALKPFKSVNPSSIKEGYFYSYIYDYSEDYDLSVLKYFDYFPCSLMFTLKDPLHVFGINFHHIPLLTRNWLLSRLKINNLQAFNLNGIHKINVSYLTLKSIMKKSPLAIRQYRTDRIHDLKIISPKQFVDIVKYQPETFHATQFVDVVSKYRRS